MKHLLKRSQVSLKLCAITGFLLCCSTIQAQDTAKAKAPELQQLHGFTQTYFFSPGQHQRAGSIAQFMENAGKYFQREIKFTPRTTVYILSPQHWKHFAAKPLLEVYGFPHNVDEERLVIAAEDNDFWRSFLPDMDKLPTLMKERVMKTYGSTDSTCSMMPFFDLLALHEMGHSYTAQAGLNMQRNWMGELFVNIMLHTYVAEKEPGLLPALETFPEMVVKGGSAGYRFTSLEDFERLYATLGMGARNYGWYQCRLHSAAGDIYVKGGKKVLVKLWKALKKHREKMSDEAFVQMLSKEVHPSVADVVIKWNN